MIQFNKQTKGENMNLVKAETRLKEIKKLLNNPNWFEKGTHDLLDERNEIEFKLNKQNVNFILRGQNKYYYAAQLKKFIDNVYKFGFDHITSKMIQKNGVCFNQYSINNGYNQYCRDMKRFSSKEELIGFVIGYNQAVLDFKKKVA